MSKQNNIVHNRFKFKKGQSTIDPIINLIEFVLIAVSG